MTPSKAALVATFAISATASADCPTQPTSGNLQSIVQNFVDDIRPGNMFGVCAVALDGKGHEGFACSGKPSANGTFTKDTLFQIGSVTKIFTGALFGRRVGEGVFAMTDRIDPLIPSQFREHALDPITLIQLATHHSGLPRDPVGGADDATEDFEIFDTCLEGGCLTPGNHGLYSNWGFQMLGYTIANADHRGFDWISDLRYNVLDMLGMTDTMLWENWQNENVTYFNAHAAHGHDALFNDRGTTPHPRCPAADPSGCLYSSPHDMRIWLQYWMQLMTPIHQLAYARDLMMSSQSYGAGSAHIAWDAAGTSSCDKVPHSTAHYLRYEKSGDVDVQRAYFGFLRDPNDGSSPIGIVIMANSDVNGPKGLGMFGQELMSRIVLQQAP